MRGTVYSEGPHFALGSFVVGGSIPVLGDDEVPAGYEIRESVNGQVSLGKIRPRIITESEEQAVRSELARLSLDDDPGIACVSPPCSWPTALATRPDALLPRAARALHRA